MAEQFLNEQTGEVTAAADYLAILRALERDIARLDNTIATLKMNLKAAKEGREHAVSDFRTAVREVKLLSEAPGRRRGKRR